MHKNYNYWPITKFNADNTTEWNATNPLSTYFTTPARAIGFGKQVGHGYPATLMMVEGGRKVTLIRRPFTAYERWGGGVNLETLFHEQVGTWAVPLPKNVTAKVVDYGLHAGWAKTQLVDENGTYRMAIVGDTLVFQNLPLGFVLYFLELAFENI